MTLLIHCVPIVLMVLSVCSPWLEKPGGGGGGRDLPLRVPLILFSWVGPRGPDRYIPPSGNRHAVCGWLKNVNTYIHTYIHTKMRSFYFFLGCFSAIATVVGIGGFGPFASLKDPFPRGPQGLAPPPTSRIVSPALV